MIDIKIPNIEDVIVPEKYIELFNNISLETQTKKAQNHNLSKEFFEQSIKQLQKRPYYLTSLARIFNSKNILEVGTAQGLQFFSFAEYVKEIDGHVWSCDIIDVRNEKYSEIYKDYTTFCLGNSKNLAESLKDKKIDLFYIDGAHDYGDVIKDVYNLRNLQSENPIWIFDDFDERFGCFHDIKKLCQLKQKHLIYKVGETASGNPNHQVVIFEKI